MRNVLRLYALVLLLLPALAGSSISSEAVPTPVGNMLRRLPCGSSLSDQPIPDDGRWLEICLLDPLAPEGTTVTQVHLKYLIEHPDPNQLEVRLRREDVGIEQILWERGKTLASGEFGQAGDLEAFHGVPSQGQWYLWIRDTVPGQRGWLRDASLAIDYAPAGPLPTLLSGTAGQPTSYCLPAGVVPSQTPDCDLKKSGREGVIPLSASGWQEIKRETFEGAFPNEGWTLIDANPNDRKEYLWDDDDYRRHGGYWAAWPANGGANGYDPAIYPYYPPNMASWMIYGPFDLSNAIDAEVIFWLWRQIEVRFDTIFFGVSADGRTFYGWRWDGEADWQEMRFGLEDHLGDASVWVGWLFKSDPIIQKEGPWVDDIIVRLKPGQVIVQGLLHYRDRSNHRVPARFTKVYLYEEDPGGSDDLLDITVTNANGFYRFPAHANWDEDNPNNRRLDLYVVWETDVNDSPSARRQVTDFGGRAYKWESDHRMDVRNGIADLSRTIEIGDSQLPAMWVFQDLRRAWEYVRDRTGIDPGSVTAKWENGRNCYPSWPVCGSHFNGGIGGPYVFIDHDSAISGDTVIMR